GGAQRALRLAPRARHLPAGPLRPGVPAPVVPPDVRPRAGAVSRGRAVLLRLPVAAVLPGAVGAGPAAGRRRGRRPRRHVTAPAARPLRVHYYSDSYIFGGS